MIGMFILFYFLMLCFHGFFWFTNFYDKENCFFKIIGIILFYIPFFFIVYSITISIIKYLIISKIKNIKHKGKCHFINETYRWDFTNWETSAAFAKRKVCSICRNFYKKEKNNFINNEKIIFKKNFYDFIFENENDEEWAGAI